MGGTAERVPCWHLGVRNSILSESIFGVGVARISVESSDGGDRKEGLLSHRINDDLPLLVNRAYLKGL